MAQRCQCAIPKSLGILNIRNLMLHAYPVTDVNDFATAGIVIKIITDCVGRVSANVFWIVYCPERYKLNT